MCNTYITQAETLCARGEGESKEQISQKNMREPICLVIYASNLI